MLHILIGDKDCPAEKGNLIVHGVKVGNEQVSEFVVILFNVKIEQAVKSRDADLFALSFTQALTDVGEHN